MPEPLGPAEAPSAATLPADAVEVGRVLGAWGVKGGLKVAPHAADAQALFATKRWYLAPAQPPRPGALAETVLLKVVQAREQGDAIVLTAQGLVDRDAAERFKGARVFVPRSSFPTPDDGEFYWVDLIGLAVIDRAGATLGTVTGLLETGPHCVLRVQPPAAAGAPDAAPGSAPETLIPFVDAYVDAVDLPGRCIRVDWQVDD